MSTVTPSIIDEGDNYDAASVNTAIQGVTDGYNAIDTDDLEREGFGGEVVHPIVVPKFATPLVAITSGSVVIAGAYPGFGATTGWTQVTIGGTDVKIVPAVAFEVGPTAPDKVGLVMVGASFLASIPNPTDEGHMAIGIKHTGIAGVEPISATDFPVSHRGVYTIEYIITEDDVPTGEDLEEIWLMAVGPDNVTITTGQLWALALHSEE